MKAMWRDMMDAFWTWRYRRVQRKPAFTVTMVFFSDCGCAIKEDVTNHDFSVQPCFEHGMV